VQSSASQDGESSVQRLLERAASGDQAAWRELIELFSPRVFALARSRVGSPSAAEEVTQSVFVTVATKLGQGQYQEQGRFEPWLFRIAMNRIRDEIRRVSRHAVASDPETFDHHPGDWLDPGADPDRPELDRLRDAVGSLNPADQEIIHLRHHAQLSFKQIASLLDEPVGTLLARHHRALSKLRAMLGEQDATALPPSSTKRALP